jgi:hypothetical protein
MTLTIHQVKVIDGVTHISQIDEICQPHPKNTLRDTCDSFTTKYGQHKEGLYVYGDRTSIKQDVKLEKGQNFFTLVYDYLSNMSPVLRLPKSNPNVRSRGVFINDCFANRVDTARITIGDNCVNSIGDYLNIVEDSDGSKLKQKVKDKKTNTSYEKHGHTSDSNDYLYCEILNKEYNRYISGNKVSEYKHMRRDRLRKPNRM